MDKKQGRFFIREQKYICGDYMDIDIYPVFQFRGKRRGKCRPTSDIQKRLNQRRAEKRLVRLVHLNFTEDDIALHLTYDEEPSSAKDALRVLYNFLQRVKRARKKAGLCPLKYITATEQGKKSGRIHHHVIMNGGLSRDQIERIWALGFANAKRLQFGPNGIIGLAHYITKGNILYRRFNTSKNLEQPEAITKDGTIRVRDIKDITELFKAENEKLFFETMYSDFRLVDGHWLHNEVNGMDYIYITMYRLKDLRFRPHKRKGVFL